MIRPYRFGGRVWLESWTPDLESGVHAAFLSLTVSSSIQASSNDCNPNPNDITFRPSFSTFIISDM